MAPFNRINRLRFFQILRPHVGEDAAEQFGDALEAEFSPLTTKADLNATKAALSAEIDSLRESIKHDQQAMLLKATAIWAALLAAAVAISRLF